MADRPDDASLFSPVGEIPPELLREKIEEAAKSDQAEAAHEFGDVESLSAETKEEAIAIAREILDKLKIVYEAIDIEELITLADEGTLDDFSNDVEDLQNLFDFEIDMAMRVDPAIVHDPDVALATDAMGLMGAMTKAYAKKKNREINDEMLCVMAQREKMQAEQRTPQLKGKTIDKLAEDVERGLNKVQERTRNAQRQLTPENLDLRLEQGMETRGLAPERSQQQSKQQQQQQQPTQQAGAQTMQAQHAMQQAMRQVAQGQNIQQAIGAAQSQRRSNGGQVQDVVRRRSQQQAKNTPQQLQQQLHGGGGEQARQSAQQQQMQQQQQRQRQAWLQQQQQRQRQLQRQMQLARELARIKVVQKALASQHPSGVHHDNHHDHHDHHADHHHDAPRASGPMSMKGDLSKLLAGSDFAALKNNLSSVDTAKTAVGPRSPKDTIKEIQSGQNGAVKDTDPPPIPPKKGPLMGV